MIFYKNVALSSRITAITLPRIPLIVSGNYCDFLQLIMILVVFYLLCCCARIIFQTDLSNNISEWEKCAPS